MKTMSKAGRVWLGIGTIVLAAGCGNATGPESPGADPATGDAGLSEATEVTLGFGQEVTVGAARLTFSAVLEESRCPVDVTCVWEGNAAVELTLVPPMEPARSLVLNTALEPRARDAAGVRVTLLEVRPLPHASSVPQEEEYTVRVRVSRIETGGEAP